MITALQQPQRWQAQARLLRPGWLFGRRTSTLPPTLLTLALQMVSTFAPALSAVTESRSPLQGRLQLELVQYLLIG